MGSYWGVRGGDYKVIRGRGMWEWAASIHGYSLSQKYKNPTIEFSVYVR
jgi:hypothetical protein